MSLAATDQCDADRARHARPRIGHMDRCRLVPYMNQVNSAADRGIENRHDVISR